AVQLVEYLVGRDDGAGKALPAVHDAMPDRLQLMAVAVIAQKAPQIFDRALMAERVAIAPLVRAGRAGAVGRAKTRARVEPFDLAAQNQLELRVLRVEDAELEARRTRVQYEDHIRHDVTRSPCRPHAAPS